jgi:hypothetical protein
MGKTPGRGDENQSINSGSQAAERTEFAIVTVCGISANYKCWAGVVSFVYGARLLFPNEACLMIEASAKIRRHEYRLGMQPRQWFGLSEE